MALDDLTKTRDDSLTRVTLVAMTIGGACLYGSITEPTWRDIVGATALLLPVFCVGAYVGIRSRYEYRKDVD